MEARAKLQEDKNYHKSTDQDTVNLYLGSIQAKLAIL
jgi:hypothetical protein